MKYLKVVIAITAAFVVFLMGLVILSYDADTQIPQDYRYAEEASLDSVESYLLNMDIRNQGAITLTERDINIILQTFKAYGFFDNPDFKVNYIYVDLEPSGGEVFMHTEVRTLLDFPTRIRLEFDFAQEDSLARVAITRISLGRVRLPRALIAWGLSRASVDLPYFDENSLLAQVDIEEVNPYQDLVKVKTIAIDDEAIRIDFGIEAISGGSHLAEGIGQTLLEIRPELADSDRAEVDRLLVLLEEEVDLESMALELKGIIETFSLEGKGLFMDELSRHLSQAEMEELLQLVEGW